MLLKIINLFTILQIYSLIGPNFASNILTVSRKPVTAEYQRLKSTNVHRGVLLSLSASQKNEICQDIYGSQLYVLPFAGTNGERMNLPGNWVRDSYRRREEVPGVPHEHRLTVQKLRELSDPLFEEEALSFECVGLDFVKRVPQTYSWIHVISAFRPKWLYSTRKPHYKQGKNYQLQDFVTLSPDYVPHEPFRLEQRYMNTRKTILALGRESQEYMELIEKRDNLSNLSKMEKFVLCASSLSSPIYRKDRLEFSLDWMYETDDKGLTLDYEKEVFFISNPAEEKMKTDCILCKAFEDATVEDSKSTNLYLTQSYNDEYSMVVMKQGIEGVFVDKYFNNIPILMTKREDVDHGFLTHDFNVRNDKSYLKQSRLP